MDNIEFYTTAAQIIPVLLLAILVQSSLVKGEIINAMEAEERRLIFEEAIRRAAQDLSSPGGQVAPDLADAWRGCAEDPQRQLDLAVQAVRARRNRDLKRSVGIKDRRPFGGSAILVLFSALLGLAVALS